MTNLIALPEGTELAGDYRIDRVLGAGGFGITYLAEEMALDRAVTIKEYFPSDFAARSPSHEAVPRSQDCSGDYRWGLDRFIEEAQTLARFDHPNIVRVYRYFRANNTGYMVLHFEEGQSLKGWLKGLGRAPRQRELDGIIAPLLDALEVIHKSDYLHRDIAPDNIIVRKSGQPVLIDFGSARGEIAAHSKTVSALVKPGYSPYEQYAETSRRQGPWTDIYALAATLYHAVTGKRPPDAPSRMVHDELIPAREAALSSYRAGFLQAIDRALALEIKDRPQNIAAWRGELLAPDPPRQGWLTRALEKKEAERQEAAEQKPGVKRTHPPLPDAPAAQGEMLDFVDQLKGGKPAKAKAQDGKPKAPAEPPVAAPASPAAATRPIATAERPRFGFFGRAKQEAQAAETPAAAPAPEAPPAAAAKPQKKSQPKSAPKAAREKAGREKDVPENAALPAAAPAVLRRQKSADLKPRPVRNGLPMPRIRPLLIKFTVGVGVAAAAVMLQNRLPKIALEGHSVPLSTTEHAKPLSPQVAVIEAHTGGTNRIAFTADGNRIVSIGEDKSLKIWRTATNTLVRIIPLDTSAKSLAVDNDVALTGSADGRIALWDLETARRRAVYQRNEGDIWSVVFTGSTERFAAASHDWTISLWETKSEQAPLHVLQGHENAVQALAYSPSGTLLASGSADKSVKLWNLTTLELLRTYRGSSDFVSAVALSPDGKLVAAASLDGTIRVWSTTSSRLRRRLSGHRGPINDLAFAPDGTNLASAGSDGTVRLWNVNKRRSVRAFAGHRGKVEAIAYAPEGGRLASAGEDGTIRIWAVDSQRIADADRSSN